MFSAVPELRSEVNRGSPLDNDVWPEASDSSGSASDDVGLSTIDVDLDEPRWADTVRLHVLIEGAGQGPMD